MSETQEHEDSEAQETRPKAYFNPTKDQSPEPKQKKKCRKRNRRIFWYNPHFNKSVTTNIGKKFLSLIDKHFGKERDDKLHKLFNRHTVKLSYSCTPNIETLIKAHNNKIISKKQQPSNNVSQTEGVQSCNCRIKTECPLPGKCNTEGVVYKATVTTERCEKTYIGSTENTFKKRFYGHKSDFSNPNYRSSTTLSNHVWTLKDRGEEPNIKWEIVRVCKKYKSGSRKCDICLTEKYVILREKGPNSLNKRSELMYTCPHRKKYRLSNLKT